MLILQVLQGPDRGRKFELPENEPQLIGRSSEALPVSDSTMSRRHAELTPDDGAWYIRDLDSSNGTFVNGRAVKSDPVELRPGDQIRCGSTLFMMAGLDEKRTENPIRMIPPTAFDMTIEGTSDSSLKNDESMILSSPDPVRAAMDHLRVIYQLTELTSTAVQRDELLERVMDLVFDEFRPDRGFILLQGTPEDSPDPVVVRYRDKPRTLDEGRIPVSRTIVEHTLRNQRGTLSTNAMNDNRFSSGDSVQDYGIRSAICVPIMAQGRTLGVLHIDSQLANFTFTEPQLQLLTAIGQHTGLVIHRAEAVQTKMQRDRLAAVGQAIASLSHSIKNILQGLRGGADAVELAMGRGDLDLARQGWPILSRNLDRIYALTLNMLTYSRPPSLDIELTSLAALVEEVAILIHGMCEAKSCGLIVDIDEDLPPIPIDSNAMHQALMNVLTNSVEAIPAKTGVITLTVGWDAEAHEAVITVADNGPGLPANLREKAFEAFMTTKGQRGTGLGLAVTRKIIREHGGTIDLESEQGKGTSVIMRLPTAGLESDPSETRLPKPMSAQDLEEF